MKCTTGFLEMMCVCTLMLSPSADAAGASCRPRELTAVTKSLVDESLAKFDEANGKHLGTWSPGFPELQVHKNSPVVPSKVQCSLIFIAQGLADVLEDQRSNLNPGDVSLHRKLEETIFLIHMLTSCVESILGGECSPQPPGPIMPQRTFERKQWSHTLLRAAAVYLEWLGRTVRVHVFEVKETNNKSGAQPRDLASLEGSGYLL